MLSSINAKGFNMDNSIFEASHIVVFSHFTFEYKITHFDDKRISAHNNENCCKQHMDCVLCSKSSSHIIPYNLLDLLLTVTCSKSCPSSDDLATTSLSAIHCMRSSISRFRAYSFSVSSRRPRLSSERSFKPAYSLSTWA